MRNLVLLDELGGTFPFQALATAAPECISVDAESGVVYVATLNKELVGYSHASRKVCVREREEREKYIIFYYILMVEQ